MTEGQRLALAAHVRDACAEIARLAGFPGAATEIRWQAPGPLLLRYVAARKRRRRREQRDVDNLIRDLRAHARRDVSRETGGGKA